MSVWFYSILTWVWKKYGQFILENRTFLIERAKDFLLSLTRRELYDIKIHKNIIFINSTFRTFSKENNILSDQSKTVKHTSRSKEMSLKNSIRCFKLLIVGNPFVPKLSISNTLIIILSQEPNRVKKNCYCYSIAVR